MTRTTVVCLISLFVTLTCVPLRAEKRRAALHPGEPPSTEALIDAAVLAGKIDADTGLEYKVFASYGDPRLPAQYRGNDTVAFDTHIDVEFARRFQSLPAPMQETLEPFLIPAYYPGSWHDRRFHANKMRVGTNGNSVLCGLDILTSWAYVKTVNGKVTVWYEAGNVGDSSIAGDIASEIDRAWPSLVKAMAGREPLGDGGPSPCRGESAAIDMAISDIPNSHARPYFDDLLKDPINRPMTVFIDISRAGDMAKDPVASAIHELMHAFQYAFEPKGSGHTDIDPLWMMEGTSQWAQHLDRPDGNEGKEQVAASIGRSMLNKPEVSLDDKNALHGYSTYLLPLFIQMKYGDTEFVGRAFTAREKRSTSAEAIDDALSKYGGFADVWPEFIRWNLNREPVDDYSKRDGLTAAAVYKSDKDVPADASFMSTMDVSLPRLSAAYHRFSFTNDAIRTVTVYNGFSQALSEVPMAETRLLGLTLGDALVYEGGGTLPPEGASVYVLTKIEGSGWAKPINITNRSYISFCRDARDERLEELVVIYGNSAYKPDASEIKPAGLTPRLVTNNIGCWGWEGSVKWSVKSGTSTEDFTATDVRWRRQFWATGGSLTRSPYTTFETVNGTGTWTVKSDTKNCTATINVTSGNAELDILNYTIGGGQHHRLAYGNGIGAGTCREGPIPWLGLNHTLHQVGATGRITGTEADGNEVWTWDFKPIREP
jgi:hypothetical protein